MRNVSPIQASAMLQSTNELNRIVSASFKKKAGSAEFWFLVLLQAIRASRNVIVQINVRKKLLRIIDITLMDDYSCPILTKMRELNSTVRIFVVIF